MLAARLRVTLPGCVAAPAAVKAPSVMPAAGVVVKLAPVTRLSASVALIGPEPPTPCCTVNPAHAGTIGCALVDALQDGLVPLRLLRGWADVREKSAELLSVSKQPPPERNSASELFAGAAAAVPSAALAVPKPMKSTRSAPAGEAPLRTTVELTSASLPLVPPMLVLKPVMSGVTGRSSPTVIDWLPNRTSR